MYDLYLTSFYTGFICYFLYFYFTAFVQHVYSRAAQLAVGWASVQRILVTDGVVVVVGVVPDAGAFDCVEVVRVVHLIQDCSASGELTSNLSANKGPLSHGLCTVSDTVY